MNAEDLVSCAVKGNEKARCAQVGGVTQQPAVT